MIFVHPVLRVAGQIALACVVAYATEYAQARARERHEDERRRRDLDSLEKAHRTALEDAAKLTRH